MAADVLQADAVQALACPTGRLSTKEHKELLSFERVRVKCTHPSIPWSCDLMEH